MLSGRPKRFWAVCALRRKIQAERRWKRTRGFMLVAHLNPVHLKVWRASWALLCLRFGPRAAYIRAKNTTAPGSSAPSIVPRRTSSASCAPTPRQRQVNSTPGVYARSGVEQRPRSCCGDCRVGQSGKRLRPGKSKLVPPSRCLATCPAHVSLAWVVPIGTVVQSYRQTFTRRRAAHAEGDLSTWSKKPTSAGKDTVFDRTFVKK